MQPIAGLIEKACAVPESLLVNIWDVGPQSHARGHHMVIESLNVFFLLAIYRELFGPDFETVFDSAYTKTLLRVETRLEYFKYCL